MANKTPIPEVTLPQYGRSTDPEAVAAVEQWWTVQDEARARVVAYAEKYSDAEEPSAYAGVRGAWYTVDGITGPVKPDTGRWKRQGRGWRPYRNNPLYAEFAALSTKLPTIPGLPHTVIAEGYFMQPHPFVHDGAAYYGFRHRPIPERYGAEAERGGWQEIKTSEFYAAREALLEAGTR